MDNIESFSYSPGIAAVKALLTERFRLEGTGEIKAYSPAFYARLTSEQAASLGKATEVSYVERVPAKIPLVTSAYYDYTAPGPEIVPWGKQAVGADDNISASNTFFMIDIPANINNLASEINVVGITDAAPGMSHYDHPISVMSIAAAKTNASKLRGINPGQPVWQYGIDLSRGDDFREAINQASSVADWAGQFSTLNVSINWYSGINGFNSTESYGRLLRRASGRMLVAQSAGNQDDNACNHAYYNNGPADPLDGIMVVDGTDRWGGRYQATQNPSPYDEEPKSSNFGSCVDVWAPGWMMTSLLESGSTITATGTSFAAPVVAALAGRYGTTGTRPIERETYIRKWRVATGQTDGAATSNLPIYEARYSPVGVGADPVKLPVTAAYARNSPTDKLAALIDAKFYDNLDFWNAIGNWGSVILDLGQVRQVSGIRIMLRSSANSGQVYFAVHGATSINITGANTASIPENGLAYRNYDVQHDYSPYYITINGNIRYVMIDGNNTTSWLAYSELEVYGN